MRNPIYSLLRFVFSLLIVGYHFSPPDLDRLVKVFEFGQIYVTFFFVLSGYLTHLSAKVRWTSFRDFAARKIGNLVPLYLAALLICTLIELRNGRLPWDGIVANALFVQAWIPDLQTSINGPAWFMSALVFCLACYPGLRWLARQSKFGLGLAAIGFWLVVQPVAVFMNVRGIEPSPYYWLYFPLFHLASFSLGAAIGDWHSSRPCAPGRKGILMSAGSCLALVLALISLHWLPREVSLAASITMFAPLFTCLVAGVNRLPHSWVSAVNKPWIEVLGALAFPIYLFQVPVFKIFERLCLKSRGLEINSGWFAAYLVCLLLVAGLWLIFEKAVIGRMFGKKPLRGGAA